jgi:hypothetical protein
VHPCTCLDVGRFSLTIPLETYGSSKYRYLLFQFYNDLYVDNRALSKKVSLLANTYMFQTVADLLDV